MSEIKEHATLVAKLSGTDLGHIMQTDADQVAKAMLADDDRNDLALLNAMFARPKRGRPPTPRKALRIMMTIEAYIGAGLSRKVALGRASKNWQLGVRYIEDVYKAQKLPKQNSRDLRNHFRGSPAAAIDIMIKEFREAE